MRSWPYWDGENERRHRPWWEWKLTARGEHVMLWLGLLLAFLIIWGFAALSTYVTGVPG